MVCQEDSHLITISKEGFDLVFVKYKRYQLQEKLDFFKQYSFFSNIPDSRLLNLINSGEKIQFQNKQLIYQEGDQVDFLYFIVSGEVNISEIYENRRVSVQIQMKKSFFGFDEIINKKKTRTIKVISNSNDLIVLAFSIKKLIQFLISFKQYDQFINECSMKINIRKNIAEQIINTQNIIHPQPELSEQRKNNENELGQNNKAIMRIRQKQKTQIELPNLSQQQINQFKPVNQLEQIVNAREEILNTLDKQKRVQYRSNKKFQSFDCQNISMNENHQDSQRQDKKQINNIFGSQKEILFDQSYYMSQNICQKNKSQLELQYQIDNQSTESTKKRQKIVFMDSQDSLSSRNSLDMKIQTLQKLKEDTSLSKFHNKALSISQHKILKKIVQNKINQANIGKIVKKNSFEETRKINSLRYIKKVSQEDFNNDCSLNQTQQDGTQNFSTLRNIEISQKKDFPLQTQTQFTKTLKEEVIKKMNRIKTNTVQRFFDSPSSQAAKDEQINNFQVSSLFNPQQLPKIAVRDCSLEKNNTSIRNNETPKNDKNENEQNSSSDQIQLNTKAQSKLLRIQRHQNNNNQSKSQTNIQIQWKRLNGDINNFSQNNYSNIKNKQQAYLNNTFNIPKTAIFKQIQQAQLLQQNK